MTKPKTFEYMRKQYTISQLSKISGLPQACIRSRIEGGWSIDKIMNTPRHAAARRYAYKGRLYTVAELAKLNGTLTASGVRHRLSRGESVEQIVSKKAQDQLTNLQKRYTAPKRHGVDQKQCKTCQYRGTLGNSKRSGVFCAYAFITGHCRMLVSPPPPDCTVYVRGKSLCRETTVRKIKKGGL